MFIVQIVLKAWGSDGKQQKLGTVQGQERLVVKAQTSCKEEPRIGTCQHLEQPPKIAAVVQVNWSCTKEMRYAFCVCQSQRGMTATEIRNREEVKSQKPHNEI